MPDPTPLTLVHADKALLRQAAGARILSTLSEVLAVQQTAHLSLTGGSMGSAVWEEVAVSPLRRMVDWSRVHFWWSDERFLPAGDADRNAQQVHEAFLRDAEVPPENVHVIGNADQFTDPEEAAAAYAQELRSCAPAGQDYPVFDLTLLGMGPDGHLASLFPGRSEVLVDREDVIAVRDSPKPPPLRVSLTLPLVNRSVRTWFLVAGADKAGAFARMQALARSSPDRQQLTATPASGARGSEQTLYLVTADALPS